MGADVVNTTQAQLEQVRPILAEVFESSDQVSSLFKKNSKNVENLSRYLYRIPLQQYRGGAFTKYSANGGSLGQGSGMKITSLQAGYFYSILMFRVTDEQVDLSQSTKQSVVNVMSKTLSDGMIEAAIMDDIALHGDGTGELTNVVSSASSDTIAHTPLALTFNTAGDTLGIRKLREGMVCDIWSQDGATKRTGITGGTLLNIETIDYATNKVTFNQDVSDAVVGDLIAFAGMDSYGPSTLVSFTSGWPATSALTTTGGLTNDSFRHGLYYAHDFNNSNYYLGKQKSALPQIAPTKIDANKQQLQFWHGFALQDKIRVRRSNDDAKNLTGIFPLSQRQTVFELGVSIATKPLSGEQFGKSVDLLPSNSQYQDTFNYCNMTCYVSKRQFNDRIDFVNLKNWGRAEVHPLRPYEKQGRTVFEGRNSSGNITAFSEFGFHAGYDFVSFDPGKEGAVTNLSVPASY
jgi:hypothetical protein